jgi:hypothetical protein
LRLQNSQRLYAVWKLKERCRSWEREREDPYGESLAWLEYGVIMKLIVMLMFMVQCDIISMMNLGDLFACAVSLAC